MIEVEAKAEISDLNRVRALARRLGKYSGREKKVDDYYTLQKKGYPHKSLRIRRVSGYYQINFKNRLSYVNGVHAKNEVEFKASNITDFLALIKDFGFNKWLTKTKISEIYEIKRNFHIELNNVLGLGWFLEVEYLAHKNEITHARREVLRVMKEFGVSNDKFVKEGYTKLLWQRTRKR